MLFCCLWCNVETSCRKRFVIISRHQQTPLLSISDKCHNLWDCGLAACVDNTWPVAVLTVCNAYSQFLPTPPAFDAHYGGSRHGKTRMAWLPDSEKILKICVYLFRQNPQTHTHTQMDRHRMTT